MSAAARDIVLVDGGGTNIGSVRYALQRLGLDAELSADAARIRRASHVILPGVGAAGPGMAKLRAANLAPVLQGLTQPLLGVCLGMQLLFERSSELGDTAGLGLLAGHVTRLDVGASGLRVPHIGWNEVRPVRPAPLTAGLPPQGAAFYHVHSYAVRPTDPGDVVATTTYGETFPTVVAHGSVMGTQFHPEKSSAHGLQLLAAFCALVSDAPRPVRV